MGSVPGGIGYQVIGLVSGSTTMNTSHQFTSLVMEKKCIGLTLNEEALPGHT